MNIVATVERYWPAVGGAERVVQRVSEGLAARGHSVTVVTSGTRSSEENEGVRIERFPVSGNRARGIKGDSNEPLALIRNLRPDILFNYAAQTWTTDACTSFLAESRTFAIIMAPCGFSALHHPAYTRYFSNLRRELPTYDGLIFHSSSYRDYRFAQDVGVEETRLHVVPNAADEPCAMAPRSEDLVLATAGSHVRSKGHAEFIRVARLLGTEVGAAGIVVAPRRHGLDALRGCQIPCAVESLRPGSRIEFREGSAAGVVEHALAQADLFVFPSRIECAPLVIIEAMAARIPWIAYDVGNVRDLAGGVIVTDFGDLVAATRKLAHDSEARRDLGGEGHARWSAGHRWPDVVSTYEQVFIAAIGE